MLRGGLVGFGRMGVTHFALLNTHPEVEMVAVCDSSGFAMKNLKKLSSVEVFADLRKMLDTIELDFLIIATPTVAHGEAIQAACATGLHMFVEKPLALTADVGRNLVELLRDRPLVNQVGYFLRFNEVFQSVKRHLSEGLIGDVLHYKSEMYGGAVLSSSKTSWRGKKELGGGCALDFASHCIDLADYLFGAPRGVAGSVLGRIYSKQVEDAVYTTLLYESALSGHILVNWSDASYRRPYNRVDIFGTRGKIVADKQECRLYLREADKAGRYPKGWTVDYLPELERDVRFNIRGTEFTAQLDHFIDCILRGAVQTDCTFATALRTDSVIESIRRDYQERVA